MALALMMPVVFTVLLISITIMMLIKKRGNAKRVPLPPGPLAWPIIGNLHQLGELPHRSLAELANKYGSLMFMRLGFNPALVVSSAEMAKEILKTHDLDFANRPATAAAKYVAYGENDPGLAPYGDFWRHMRKISVMELLSTKRVESFMAVREEEASVGVRSIWENSMHGTVAVNVTRAISSVVSAIMWRILAGTNSLACSDLVGSGDEITQMAKEVTDMVGAFNIADFFPYLDWLDDLRGMKRRMIKAHNFFDQVVGKIIEQHVERNAQMDSKVDSNRIKDLVDVLLQFERHSSDGIKVTREHIKGTIFDMLLGGLETTIVTLEWAMSEMVRNLQVAKTLQQEIESVVGNQRMARECDLANMEYLQCVVKETFRLHPAGPLMLPHESRQACTVAGYHIPNKTRLVVNVWAIGRDPAVWEDPLTFKPERFMGIKDTDSKGKDFHMLPFGAGRRGCPGALLATRNIQMVLAQLMHCFNWMPEGNIDPSRLDMTEIFRTSIPRKVNLYAVPSLKLEVNL